MQNSRPSSSVRYSGECSCGAWGTAEPKTRLSRRLIITRSYVKRAVGNASSLKLNARESAISGKIRT